MFFFGADGTLKISCAKNNYYEVYQFPDYYSWEMESDFKSIYRTDRMTIYAHKDTPMEAEFEISVNDIFGHNMKLLSNKRKYQIPDFEALKTFKPTGRLKTLFRK